MEQKDYMLREIEKIGLILSSIRQKLFGGQDKLAISQEKQIDDVKSMLLSELNFDLEKFISIDNEEFNKYLSNFDGFNIENIERLADCISQIGQNNKSEEYLNKALQLYVFCNIKSKTFSFEREEKIASIKNAL